MRELRRLGLGVAAISYDSTAVLRDFARRHGISFPLISDPESKIIRAWGLLNVEAYPDDPSRQGIPHPGTFVLSRDGVILEKHFEEGYRERVTAGRFLVDQIGIPAEAIEVASDSFSVHTFPTSPEVYPGHEIGLVLELTLGEDLHAYAPGDHSYRALALQMEPSELVRFGTLELPEPVLFEFEPLEEVVPVFEGTVRVVQPATLLVNDAVRALSRADDRTIEIRGKLLYQVCSSEVCYPPAEGALRWRFDVRPLEMERAPEEIRKRPGGP